MSSEPSDGYVDVDDLSVWVERSGHGEPVVLLHGAMGSIDSCFAQLVPVLAERFEVIAMELQGHGHTPDIDRPFSYQAMASDVVQVLDALNIDRAHVAGYSMGGAVALQVAIDHPGRVNRVVFFGGPTYTRAGLHPELVAAFETFDPHELDGTSWHDAYRRVAPDPDSWTNLVTKVNQLDRTWTSFGPDSTLSQLAVPVLLVVGDADIARLEHVVEMFRLLGGGVPGDLMELPSSQLAVLPGTTHVGMLEHTDWVGTMITAFLTNPRHEP